MNQAPSLRRLKEAISQSGNAWLFRFWGRAERQNLSKLRSEITEFMDEYERRFGQRPDPFDLLALTPWKGAAFFHVDTLAASLQIKIAVWRILAGFKIIRVDFRWQEGQSSNFQVVLRPPGGSQGSDETYESNHWADFRVLRHFGPSAVDQKLYLAGYYPGVRS